MNAELERRIQRLEARCRVLMAAVVFSIVAAVVLVAYFTRHIPEQIVAHSISVVGSAGKNAATLGATRDGFVILGFNDLKGKPRFALLMTPSGKPTLSFFGDKSSRLNLGVVDGPHGEEFSLQLKDSRNNTIWQPNVSNGY